MELGEGVSMHKEKLEEFLKQQAIVKEVVKTMLHIAKDFIAEELFDVYKSMVESLLPLEIVDEYLVEKEKNMEYVCLKNAKHDKFESDFSTTTLLGWTPQYDGSGKLLNSNPNTTEEGYRCLECNTCHMKVTKYGKSEFKISK